MLGEKPRADADLNEVGPKLVDFLGRSDDDINLQGVSIGTTRVAAGVGKLASEDMSVTAAASLATVVLISVTLEKTAATSVPRSIVTTRAFLCQ